MSRVAAITDVDATLRMTYGRQSRSSSTMSCRSSRLFSFEQVSGPGDFRIAVDRYGDKSGGGPAFRRQRLPRAWAGDRSPDGSRCAQRPAGDCTRCSIGHARGVVGRPAARAPALRLSGKPSPRKRWWRDECSMTSAGGIRARKARAQLETLVISTSRCADGQHWYRSGAAWRASRC